MPITSVDLAKQAQLAIEVQDAVNLSGVVHTFAEVMSVLSDYAFENNLGTEWKNTHPIVTLFIDKLADLNRFPHDGAEMMEKYHQAYVEVKRIAREGT